MGGELYINAAWPDVYNNTICFNDAEDTGGGISFHGICNSDFRNNILWGNTGRIGGPGSTAEFNQLIINTVTSQPNFYNCIIQKGLEGFSLVPGVTFNGVFSETIDKNPLFRNAPDSIGIDYDALTADWSLDDSSAAINSGNNSVENILISATDSWGNPRIKHGIIDIGAYEAHIPEISTGDTTIATNTRWIADTVRIGGDIYIKDSIVLDISPGCYIEFQGNYKLDVQGTLKAIGTEQSPITFSIHDTTGFSDTDTTLGGWYGIVSLSMPRVIILSGCLNSSRAVPLKSDISLTW
ncbi:MAG: hypothetical protein AMS27_15750 [Bacteroides sp. SM23_62_1]|nr:MAG: hypothetical protein AMS27_15750 [Bacteroides sp. SM23_62_1]